MSKYDLQSIADFDDLVQDWITLFDLFTWWLDNMEVSKETFTRLPFREIVESWEKTFLAPPMIDFLRWWDLPFHIPVVPGYPVQK